MIYDFLTCVFDGTPEEFEVCVRTLTDFPIGEATEGAIRAQRAMGQVMPEPDGGDGEEPSGDDQEGA
jgi:hypothetical protein